VTRRNQVVSIVVAAGFALTLVFPFLPISGGLLRTVTVVIMAAANAQAWNLIGGYAGYGAFGNVAFFGVGGYTTAICMTTLKMDFIPAALLGGLVSALYAALLGAPILRLRGHYFSIATLGVAEATREIVANLNDLTGGGSGILLPISADSPEVFNRFIYFCMLAVLVGGILLTFVVTRSKLGYGLIAIREDEDAARATGIDTTRYKVIAFGLNALITGLAGGVYAYWNSQLTPPDAFTLDVTLRAIIVSIIGGPGTLFGPVIGAIAFEFARDFLWNRFQGLQFTFLGVVMVLVIIFMPKGIMEFMTGRRRFTAGGLLQYVRQNRVA
jgi:branched-chain amino acid transport system permease protein